MTRRVFLLSSTLSTQMMSAAKPRFMVHGHRGAMALKPENTIPSFEQAINDGADYIELDVYASRDNVLVVMHDPTFNPLIHQGPFLKKALRSLTLEEIRQMDCGSLKNRSFPLQEPAPGAKVPTLDEVFDLTKKSDRFGINIEIKSNERWKDYTPPPDEFCEMVAAAIRRRKLEKRVFVQSFDFRVVKAMKKIAPDFVLSALYGPGERTFVDIAQENGVKIVTPNFALVTPEKVRDAHNAGIQIVPWTVDAPADWDRMIAAGVDGIITNDPGKLIAHLKSKGLR